MEPYLTEKFTVKRNYFIQVRMVLEKGYIQTLSLGLPNTAEVDKLKAKLLSHVKEKVL